MLHATNKAIYIKSKYYKIVYNYVYIEKKNVRSNNYNKKGLCHSQGYMLIVDGQYCSGSYIYHICPNQKITI